MFSFHGLVREAKWIFGIFPNISDVRSTVEKDSAEVNARRQSLILGRDGHPYSVCRKKRALLCTNEVSEFADLSGAQGKPNIALYSKRYV